MRYVPLLILPPLLFTLLGGTASACPPDGGATMFELGTRAMDEANPDYATACRLLKKSYECDETKPARLGALARCTDLSGNIATALTLYEEYLARFAQMPAALRQPHEERARIAKERSKTIRPDVPQITLTVPALTPLLTHVRLDGREVLGPSLGKAMPIDPGEHTVETEAPGGPVTLVRFTIARGEKKPLELEVKPPPAPPEPPPAPTGPGARRIGTYVIASASLTAVAIGVVSGLIAVNKANAIKDVCNTLVTQCSPSAKGLVATEAAAGQVATIAFAVGLTGSAIVTVFFLTESTPHATQRSSALLTLHGVW